MNAPLLQEIVDAIDAVHRSVGAPGDYGYETPTGKALFALYRAEGKARLALDIAKRQLGDMGCMASMQTAATRDQSISARLRTAKDEAASAMLAALKGIVDRAEGKLYSEEIARMFGDDWRAVHTAIALAEAAGISERRGPSPSCGKPVDRPHTQNSCTRDAGHDGECRCKAADVDARAAGQPTAS